MWTHNHTYTNITAKYRPTLMRSIPASILSCSTSFLAWAILLVVDILIHQTAATQEKTERHRELDSKVFPSNIHREKESERCLLATKH